MSHFDARWPVAYFQIHSRGMVFELNSNNLCEDVEPSQGFQSENHFVDSMASFSSGSHASIEIQPVYSVPDCFALKVFLEFSPSRSA